ncbi:hypothetical protein [Streptomyces sp. 351MFTsu5.1]|nr:hypothetical protein [Streptomyces sp. 351MFTsu5.1]
MTAPPDAEPNWRTNPAALDRLCEQGRQEMCGETLVVRDVTTIKPSEDYL